MEVLFCYGVGSRYSYLAATQIEALVRDSGCHVVWTPVDSHRLIAMRGGSPFAGQPLSGQYEWGYRQLDAERWAAFYGVPYAEPDAALVRDPAMVRRWALACSAAARLGAAESFSRRLFNRIFVLSAQSFDDEELADLAEAAGLGRLAFQEALSAPETLDVLDRNSQQAAARGAFGVPSFIVGDALFWGNDRLVLLRHHLKRLGQAG